ncbi:MAG TPA: HAMP domain-containing sensor histidine kinase, partial [Bacteroidia bacterium]|nr:HAMP domain-containing sensor histidine kinase [Bacteroidia bacterium]
TSLSGTSKEMYNTWSIENQLTPDIDILTALDTIENRSKGLMQFVKAYRLMAKVPEPQKVVIQLDKMLRKIKSMFDVNQNSNLIISVDSTMTIFADEQLIEQVMINVIKNAEESLQNSDQKDIVVSASANANQMLKIEVQDNGCGIEDELLDQIFIPFFTTKSNGSGIGLSLSKQIMRMHQGNIEINRRAQGGTTVSICLPLH